MQKFVAAFLIIALIHSLVSDDYALNVLAVTIFISGYAMYRIGKGLVLMEMMAFHCCLTCIMAPLMGFTFYGADSDIARLWVKVMTIEPNRYFDFVLPATIAYIIGLTFPFGKNKSIDFGESIGNQVMRIQQYLSDKTQMGLVLLAVGFACYYLRLTFMGPLQHLFQIFYYFLFTGVLYVYYQKTFRLKWLIYVGVFSLLAYDAIKTGMFTIVAYMSITIFSIFLLRKKIPLYRKLIFVAFGFSLFLVIQASKYNYRNATWTDNFEGSKAQVLREEMSDKITNFSALFSEKAFFPIYTRMNQGHNIQLVIQRIPDVQDFDYGGTLIQSMLSAFVPRLFWPDKPEVGGVFNMKHYVGVDLVGWSTNIGPIGEAWGNFGKFGGIIYMFFLGFFVRWCFTRIFVWSKKRPLLLLWIPVLFYEATFAIEGDSLQTFNSIFKAAFVVWGLSKVFPAIFGEEKELLKGNPKSAKFANPIGK
jgi:hypothetical protein